MSAATEVHTCCSSIASHADQSTAAGMSKYMRELFLFLGVKSRIRKESQKSMLQKSKRWTAQEIMEAVNILYNHDEREYHYVACDLLRLRVKKLDQSHLKDLRKLVLMHSWWDTVDSLALTIGDFLQKYPHLQPETTDAWMASNELWLRRVALIHQLRYKEKTDWPMLQRYVESVKDSSEFFIQKGAGWALRQYSKTHPERVMEFVNRTKLMPLTRREAIKYL